MISRIILICLFASSICLAQDPPVVKFPSKEEIEKAEIKELIKTLDAKSKIETTKKEKQESSQLPDSTNFLPLQNRPSSSKYYFKKNKSRLLCPT